MTLSLFTSSLLPGGMLILTLLLVARMRLASMVTLFRLQSVFLGIYAFALAVEMREAGLLAVAILVLVLKAGIIPTFLTRVARESGASERLQSFLRPTTLTFIGAIMTAAAFYAAHAVETAGHGFFIVGVSFSLILLGLLSLIARTDMYGQGIGFLVMESGVFTFGLALTGGMPLLVELGALTDVLTLFVLVALLVRRAQKEHRAVTTDYLKALID